MSRTILQTLILAALASLAGNALADPPAVVGRISSVQGEVTVVGEGEPAAAILNWPVTNADHISTTRGGRTEFRVGSTAVRVDGDSDLEITDLDEDLLRLRLNYGSVIIRVKDPELLRNFELTTPQARVTLLEPGEIRVDADRTPDTSQVSVLAGSARVDGAGSSMTLAVGRRADVGMEDVRTSVAGRDHFDIWAQTRDREADTAISTRYIPAEVTGYEELDRNGTWRETAEYGAVWTPRSVASDWAPYRDGQWIWRDQWGWTWIDNAPWGYAPSHYGRWVLVDRRWCWAPGRIVGRPVWSPALVGWVGGNQLQVNVANRGRAPGLGWYPLGPRDHYVPPYRVSVDHERRLAWTHNGREERHDDRRDEHRSRDGVTVLPRDQFEARRRVQVNRGPAVIMAPSQLPVVSQVSAPHPAGPVRVTENNRGNWNGRNDRNDRDQRPGNGRNDYRPGNVVTPNAGLQLQTQPGAAAPGNDRGRFGDDVRRQQRQPEEQVQREQQRRDQVQREQVQREQAQREQGQRDQSQRERAQREQVQRDQAQQAQRDAGQREQAAREQTQREQAMREQSQREQAQRDHGQREQAQREQAQREQAMREQSQREQAQRDHGQRDQGQREQAQREQALREQAQRESQREAGQRAMLAQQAVQQAQQAQREQAQQRAQQQQQPQPQQQRPQPQPQPQAQPQAQPNRGEQHDGRSAEQRKEAEKRKEEGRDRNQIAR
jgi:hypothetical protein